MKNYLIILIATFSFQVSSQYMPEKFNDFYNELMMSEPKKATKKLDQAIKKEPNEPWYYWMAAEFQVIMGDDAKAQKNYEKAIAVDPKFSGGYASLARFLAYKDSAQLDNALFNINKALQIEPNDGQYYIDRGSIYLELKEYDKAMRDANYASTKDADPMRIDRLKIEILYQSGKTNELREFLDQTELSQIGMFIGVDLSIKIATIYEEMGEVGKACEILNGATESYTMFDQEIPNNLQEKLKNCK